MTLSHEDSALVAGRSSVLSIEESSVLEALFGDLWAIAAEAGVPTDKGDECAKLEAAAIRYLVASRR